MMDKKFDEYFHKLVEIRRAGTVGLNQGWMKNLRNLLIDKYSDQAHFVYELIQNAADAGAVRVRFKLEKDKLYFIHDGIRHFELTNPDTEEEDAENNKLGDLNAITSFGNSSKANDDGKIGRFGIGFKAVFKYTNTPIIYDEKVFFRLENYVVPVIIDDDCPLRGSKETAFELPFNIVNASNENSYNEILGKLRSLVLPMVFLNNIKEITYESASCKGYYKCEIINKEALENDIVYERLGYKFVELEGDDQREDKKTFMKFSRLVDDKNKVSLAYLLDDNNQLIPGRYNAFCFFKTVERTGLPFLVHAPFKLADNRASIMANDKHNLNMISSLADLAADSLVRLRDLGIKDGVEYLGNNLFDIIPYDIEQFDKIQETEQISFIPIYEKLKLKLQTAKVIPAGENVYIRREHAYWSPKIKLMELFSNKQLQMLVDDDKACWLAGKVPKRGNSEAFNEYISDIVAKVYSPNEFLKLINKEFVAKQTQKWLIELYKYIIKNRELIEISKRLPILLDQDKKPAAAYDEDNKKIIFKAIDEDEISAFTVVYPPFAKDPVVKEFLKQLEIEEPWLKNEIELHILPAMSEGKIFDASKFFGRIVKYYSKLLGAEKKKYIDDLHKCRCFFRKDNTGGTENLFPSEIYKYSDRLEKYFSGVKEVKYFDYNMLKRATARAHSQDSLNDFLADFELDKSLPKIIKYHYDAREAEIDGLPYAKRSGAEWVEERIEGLQENIDLIEDNNDVNRAYLLWGVLLDLFKANFERTVLEKSLSAIAKCDNGKGRGAKFEASDIRALKNSKWLVNSIGELVTPSDISIHELSQSYALDNLDTQNFLEFLGVRKDSLNDLPKQQREKLELMYELERFGVSESELRELLARKKREKLQDKAPTIKNSTDDVQTKSADVISKTSNMVDSSKLSDVGELFSEFRNAIFSDKVKNDKIKDNDVGINKENIHAELDDEEIDYPDEDAYTKAPFNFEAKIKREEKKAEEQREQIKKMQELSNEAEHAEQYSFGWFMTLLAMEQNASDNGEKKREFNIKFSKVEKESGTEKTLCFSRPDKPIPTVMEEASNVKVEFSLRNGKSQTANIDAMSVKGNTLKVKLRSADEIADITLSDIKESKITVANLDFLLEKLIDGFNSLEFKKDYNLKDNLTSNIQFVFGPPGTGKTTYLANKVICPFMKEKNRVLVLTPTNKAADVLAKRVYEVAADKEDCINWLIRFGSTNDEFLEKKSIFKDKTTPIQKYNRCTVVATIARFSYDYFIVDGGKRVPLENIDWDYIIFDEASMIHLPNIIYPLYKTLQNNTPPKRFIIAGDPIQIEPVAKVDLWKDENIYKLVKLSNFKNPQTEPYNYPVVTLTTQYRSIPAIGDIYSKFAYNGLLSHNRKSESIRKLNIEHKLALKPLNLVKFPVSRYEGVYKPKRLLQSHYHVYAALFAVEFARFIAEALVDANGNKQYSIGVIAPYRAEASLIDKLLAQIEIPKSINILAGTIHGFQGDECDIVLCVFNPPPSISNNPNMFLNKRNIINVAISRAKDYLIVIMPDNNTRNINSLYQVRTVENLIKEHDYAEFSSSKIEEIMFNGHSTYLEDNSFTTTHQDVNVYGLPEKYYEIRSERESIDVQIHKDVVTKHVLDDVKDDTQTLATVKSEENTQLEEKLEVTELPAEELYTPHIDLDNYLDSYGWSVQELVTIVNIYERYESDGEDITHMIGELTKLLSETIKSSVDAAITKEDIGYKLGVFGRLARGQSPDMAGASDLDYVTWQIYKKNPDLYKKLIKNVREMINGEYVGQ